MSARVLINWPSLMKLGPNSSSASRIRLGEGNPDLKNTCP
jgi:hypothetical protein